ncbi:M57 family metalloprotease [Pontibacter arcticus]|uniref:Protease n=1 Tax=Pontibacter arcticus TaxID=2080288 RepID=A0A364RCR7_9BACT|nr:M57 family metalloprotease [Pontibacter arcticus]RAU82073.1 protease [Pontibacter arcticus]
MKSNRFLVLAAIAAVFSFSSCQKEDDAIATQSEVSESTLTQIKNLGFNNKNVQRVEGGYLVEGDIVLTEDNLKEAGQVQALRVGEAEQYRTTRLVTGLPRTITVSISSTLPTSYVAALDEAIARYNAQGLRITFRRVSSGANIALTKAPSGASYLASAGFPTSGGNPYNSVVVNSTYIGTNPNRSYLATILAHEIGHCIGFRHTDYMDRSYSCGGGYTNEGASTVGAIQIPGTPASADPNSWMLACIGTGASRPFNANDRTALNYIY